MSTRLINTRKNYQTYTKTVPGDNGLVIPFENVCTGHVGVVHVICDGATNINALPFQEPVYIKTAAALNLTTAGLGINGNCLVIHNTSATARTITLDGSTSFSLAAYATAIWRYNTTWWNEADSEFGTFSPGITFGGGSTGITYTTQSGWYSKKTDLCFINLTIILTSKGTSTGSALITNMPFTSSSDVYNISDFSIRLSNTTFDYPTAQIGNLASFIVLLTTDGSTGTTSNITDANFTNTSRIQISGQYRIR